MSSYLLLVRWNANVHRTFLPMYLIVQTVLSLGIVIGLGYLVPNLDEGTMIMLATGAPTLLLLVVGLVVVPQGVSQTKSDGSYDWFRTLPVPRWAYLAADLTLWLAVALPGIAIALAVAALRYDLALSVSPLVVPAGLLVGLSAAAVGHGLASLLPPQVTMLATQVLVFFTLLFSPVNFPAERLPGWLQAVHTVLPIEPMADIMRGTLASAHFDVGWPSFAIVAAWCLLGLFGAIRTATRRI